MILDYNKFKPIKTFGMILTVAGLAGCVALTSEVIASEPYKGPIILPFILIAWHVVTGIGILSRKRWGFVFLKTYLYIMYLGIPVGTWLSKKILRYIKDHEIERFFSGKELRL